MDKRQKVQRGEEEINVVEYISKMPSIKLPNYIFQNKGNDQFEQKMNELGLGRPFCFTRRWRTCDLEP